MNQLIPQPLALDNDDTWNAMTANSTFDLSKHVRWKLSIHDCAIQRNRPIERVIRQTRTILITHEIEHACANIA